MKDFYKTLDLSENASEADIKRAYRRLAKKYHPDANQGDKQAEARFKEISEANEVLSDKNKRAQFDQMRKYGGGFADFGGARPGAGFGTGGIRFEDLSSVFGKSGGFGSFADIFSSIFGDNLGDLGAGSGFRQTRGPRKGDDLYTDIEIPFSKAVNGGKVNIRLNVNESCSVCKGTGSKPGSSQRICPDCRGRGTVSFTQGNFAVSRPCPRCLGRGKISGEACSGCAGIGSVSKRRELSVRIPSGVESGKKIRLKGLGNPGRGGGPPGDLYLRVDVTSHPFFWRRGLDIHCRIPLSIEQAVKGTRIRVRTLSGKKAELKIPPGTKAGAKFRLKELGLASKKNKGDQIVEIDIKTAENMSDEDMRNSYEAAEGTGARDERG